LSQEEEKRKFNLGVVTLSEYLLVIRGLECLKKELLDEAAVFAEKKLSYEKEALSEIYRRGRERLEQVQAANRMQERWNAKFGKVSRQKP
jgi:hypothetical protein